MLNCRFQGFYIQSIVLAPSLIKHVGVFGFKSWMDNGPELKPSTPRCYVRNYRPEWQTQIIWHWPLFIGFTWTLFSGPVNNRFWLPVHGSGSWLKWIGLIQLCYDVWNVGTVRLSVNMEGSGLLGPFIPPFDQSIALSCPVGWEFCFST